MAYIRDNLKEITFTGGRRWLLGSKAAPFQLRSLQSGSISRKSFITHYAQSGPYIAFSNQRDQISWRYHHGDARGQSKDITINDPVVSIKPIPGTYFFLVTDSLGKIFILENRQGKLIPVSKPNEQQKRFLKTAIIWATIEDKSYIFAATNEYNVLVFLVTMEAGKIVIKQENEGWKTPISQPISSLATYTFNGTQYLLVASLNCLFRCKLQDAIGRSPDFENVGERIQKENTSGMLPSFLVCNDTHVVWFTFNVIYICDIATLSVQKKLSTSKLASLINTTAQDLIIDSSSSDPNKRPPLPLIMTKNHLVVASPQYLVAISLSNGVAALRAPFTNRKILSISRDEQNPLFTIATENGVIIADYTNETTPTDVKNISEYRKDAIATLTPRPTVKRSEILISLMMEKKWDQAISLLEGWAKGGRTREQKELIAFLINEIQIIVACETDQTKIEQLSTKQNSFGRLVYQLQMRSFAPIIQYLSSDDFTHNQTASAQLIRLLINLKQYEYAIMTAIAFPECYYLLSAIAIRAPEQFTQYLTPSILDIATPIIPTVLPYIGLQMPLNLIKNLLREAIKTDQRPFAASLIWSATLVTGDWQVDQEVMAIIQQKPTFQNMLFILDFFRRSDLHRCSAIIAKCMNRYDEAVRLARLDGPKAAKIYEKHVPKWMRHHEKKEETAAAPEASFTRQDVINELTLINTKVRELTNKAEENASLIGDITSRSWAPIERNQMQEDCSVCHGKVEDQYVGFQCGHVFHIGCLKNEMLSTLSPLEAGELRDLLNSGKCSSEDQRRIDELITTDCPVCGMISIHKLTVPYDFTDDGKATWSLSLE